MPKILSAGYGFYEALAAEGFQFPDECVDVRLLSPMNGVMQLRYTVNLRPRDLEIIGRALTRMKEQK